MSEQSLSEDQVSGRFFFRLNALAAAIGVALLLGGALAGERGSQAQPRAGLLPVAEPSGPAAASLWDEGQAEVARYAARRKLYGRPQAYELVRITVKEPFDPRRGVKPDEADGRTYSSFKGIAVHDTPTQRAYRYRQQVVVHVARAEPSRLLAASSSSQEWCGNTFVRILGLDRAGDPSAAGFLRVAHSYWGQEGERTDTLPAGVWFEDQLPLTLRFHDWERTPELPAIRLVPTLLSNRAPATQPELAKVERLGEERIKTPLGELPCRKVRVSVGSEQLDYWFGSAAPHPLVRFKDRTGEGTLQALERSAYWRDPVGKGARPPAGKSD